MIFYSFIITPTGSHIQIYREIQLYNELYLYTIGLHRHIMQEHIKGPCSEILQKHKKNITVPHKKGILKIKIYIVVELVVFFR